MEKGAATSFSTNIQKGGIFMKKYELEEIVKALLLFDVPSEAVVDFVELPMQRVSVTVNGAQFGIYDFDRHTFVD